MDARRGLLALLQRLGQAGFEAWRWSFGRVFDADQDPLRHLGALTIFFLWIVLISGIWLFAFFETSVHGAYGSVEELTHQQWYLGGVMRSLHRYASDALIVHAAAAHHQGMELRPAPRPALVQLGHRRAAAVADHPARHHGYWLVWDGLAQYVALTSAELLDRLPIFTDSMARNFLSDAALSDASSR